MLDYTSITNSVISVSARAHSIVRSLSGNQARLVLALLEENEKDIDPDGVMRRLGVSRGYALKLLHELTAKGWLHRQAPARYRIVPPEWGPHRLPSLDVHEAALAHAPDGYVGLASAARLHGLTTQHRRVTFVLVARRKREIELNGSTIRFVLVKPKHVFGTEQRLELGEKITVSDPEKTALDCLEYGIGTFDFSELTAIVARVLRRGEWERLVEYLRRFDSGPLARRLATLMTLAKISYPQSTLDALSAVSIPRSPIRLDPTRPASRTDPLDHRWGIRVNVPPSDLFHI